MPFTVPALASGEAEVHGLIDVGLTVLTGAAADRVVNVIPDITAPEANDLAPHPKTTVPTSRTRIVLAPTTIATVGAFNDLLAANDLTIIGGLTTLKQLIVATPDPGDHSAVIAAATALRASSLVAGAALDVEVTDERVPRPLPGVPPQDPLAGWLWTDPATAPTAADGNWGLRDIRAPQAWNLLDAARAANNPAGDGRAGARLRRGEPRPADRRVRRPVRERAVRPERHRRSTTPTTSPASPGRATTTARTRPTPSACPASRRWPACTPGSSAPTTPTGSPERTRSAR